MLLPLPLTAALVVGPTEAPPASSEGGGSSVTSSLVAPSPHVGKGHFTFGTSGNLSYLAGAPNSLLFSLGVSGAYFVHDRLLLGANVGFSVSSYFGPVAPGTTTTSVLIPVGVFGQYWHPLGGRLFLLAGLSISVTPSFGGVAIFVTDWLALEPSFSTSFSGTGTGGFSATVAVGWGMAYFI